MPHPPASRPPFALLTAVLLALAGGAAGCGEALDALGDAAGGGGFAGLYDGYFQECAFCHTPTGPGRTSDTEQSLDFSTQDSAYRTLANGSATGLVGNSAPCNGLAFVGATYETSLVAAGIDEDVRRSFDVTSHSSCDADTISDMALKVGEQPSSSFLASLKAWIDAGAPAP